MASTQVKFALTVTTTAALVGGYFASTVTPSLNVEDYNLASQLPQNFGSALTSYNSISDFSEISRQIETIHKFASNILENIEDLDADYSKAIDENYWDLI